jgi:hypothetical protein
MGCPVHVTALQMSASSIWFHWIAPARWFISTPRFLRPSTCYFLFVKAFQLNLLTSALLAHHSACTPLTYCLTYSILHNAVSTPLFGMLLSDDALLVRTASLQARSRPVLRSLVPSGWWLRMLWCVEESSYPCTQRCVCRILSTISRLMFWIPFAVQSWCHLMEAPHLMDCPHHHVELPHRMEFPPCLEFILCMEFIRHHMKFSHPMDSPHDVDFLHLMSCMSWYGLPS